MTVTAISPGALKWWIVSTPERNREHVSALHALYRRHDWLMAYAIQAGEGGPVKIGQTTGKPRDRLKTLQQGNPFELKGIAAWRILPGEEQIIHAAFAEYRIRGEWFEPAPDLIDFVTWEGGYFCDWEPGP